MAVTSGQGHSEVEHKRRYEDYKSIKQYFQHKEINEVIISGNVTTDAGPSEISFVTGDVIDYIAAEGQVYIRTEADDANQQDKYVYIEYQDDTGAIKTILTADLTLANTTTEAIVTGADDFFRLRRMYGEVESATGGGKMITLCDADWDGAADGYGYISDGQSDFALERFFTQPSATCDSYLVHLHAHTASQAGAATDDTYYLTATLTPRASSWGAEVAAASDKTLRWNFQDHLHVDPLILLEPATEVIFKVGDTAAPGIMFLEAVMLEIYK